ncbi:MAG: indole-3-glycerol phosphate synthase [Bacteroidetes bacterium GWF2_33_16]|nr:MAG: indole-3-glycerol phosphate synthase [Bacteroidetes bacterium GWE2_32_14]OFY04577.1 MAG: indole-3-glycerol phosphate synthase [Bacteroidetes bacterium GWF2_33_16]
MNILEKIVIQKRKEIEERKSLYPVKLLEQSIYFETQPVSLKKYLLRPDKSGIIAEFKTKSPSKREINPYANVEKVTIGYMQAGASALSVLTDKTFFGGSFQNLTIARKYNYCPILQKDFLLDEYQLIEARSIGADVILLIAAVLTKDKLKQLAALAKSLKLEVLCEVHSSDELIKLNEFVDIVGVNNRNLETFEVDINRSIELSTLIPSNFLKISESGIKSPLEIVMLKKVGFNGFLIGGNFMSNPDPGKACRDFIQQLKIKENQLNKQNIIHYETESLRVE